MIPRPYTDEGEIRIFSKDIDPEYLIWHYDNEDRWVTIISGDWLFQFDNELPKRVFDGEIIFIPKGKWHKVYKGTKDLIIKIKKGQSD